MTLRSVVGGAIITTEPRLRGRAALHHGDEIVRRVRCEDGLDLVGQTRPEEFPGRDHPGRVGAAGVAQAVHQEVWR